jgi:hypothetical protein
MLCCRRPNAHCLACSKLSMAEGTRSTYVWLVDGHITLTILITLSNLRMPPGACVSIFRSWPPSSALSITLQSTFLIRLSYPIPFLDVFILAFIYVSPMVFRPTDTPVPTPKSQTKIRPNLTSYTYELTFRGIFACYVAHNEAFLLILLCCIPRSEDVAIPRKFLCVRHSTPRKHQADF